MLDDKILSAAWLTLELRARHDSRVAAIVIDTIADHVREGYRVRAWCGRCARTTDVDIGALMSRGLGPVPFTRIAQAFRCSQCGEPGQIIRTPADRAYQ